MGAIRALTALAGTTLLYTAVAAQIVITVADRPAEGHVKLSRVATLVQGPDNIGFSDRAIGQSSVSGNRYYVVDPLSFPEQVIVLDRMGRYQQRIGGRGDGPGEFIGELNVIGEHADSLLVYNPSRRSVSVFDPALRFVRRYTTFVALGSSAILEDGRIVTNAFPPTAEAIGFPVHVLDATGRRIHSFGKTPRSYTPDTHFGDTRVIARGPTESVWVAHKYRYVIEHWTLSGQLRQSFVRRVDWFPPYQEGTVINFPRAEITKIAQDSEGLLWIQMLVPDPQAPAVPIVNDRLRMDRASRETLYDTIVEVLDPANGLIIASSRHDGIFRGTMRPDMVMGFEETPSFEGLLTVWQMRREIR